MMKYLDGFLKPIPKTTFYSYVRATVIAKSIPFNGLVLKWNESKSKLKDSFV